MSNCICGNYEPRGSSGSLRQVEVCKNCGRYPPKSKTEKQKENTKILIEYLTDVGGISPPKKVNEAAWRATAFLQDAISMVGAIHKDSPTYNEDKEAARAFIELADMYIEGL